MNADARALERVEARCASPRASARARRSRRASCRRSARRTSRARCGRPPRAGGRVAGRAARRPGRPRSAPRTKARMPPTTRRRSTAETCSWMSRSGACDEQHAVRALARGDVEREHGRPALGQPLDGRESRWSDAVSSTSRRGLRRAAERGAESATVSRKTPLRSNTATRPAPSVAGIRLHRLAARECPSERVEVLGGVARQHARPQRVDARLLEVVLERRQDERREHDQREQRRGRSDHREPHAQAARALQRVADHVPKRYPTPRTVRISYGADGSRSSFSRRCRMWTSIVRCSR